MALRRGVVVAFSGSGRFRVAVKMAAQLRNHP